MPEKYYLRIAAEDHCKYLWDYNRGEWLKIITVDSRDLPRSIRESVKEDLEKNNEENALLKSIKI